MKNTVNKTIPFKQRDDDKNDNPKPNSNNKTLAKVIPYPKYKKKKEKGIKFIKKNKLFIIILGVVAFFGLILFMDTVLLKGRLGPNGKPMQNSEILSSNFYNLNLDVCYNSIKT